MNHRHADRKALDDTLTRSNLLLDEALQEITRGRSLVDVMEQRFRKTMKPDPPAGSVLSIVNYRATLDVHSDFAATIRSMLRQFEQEKSLSFDSGIEILDTLLIAGHPLSLKLFALQEERIGIHKAQRQ